MDIGLLLLRLLLGTTFVLHGAQKLFGWFGGPGLDGAGAGFEALGFVPGKRTAFLAGSTEVLAGLVLAAGLATPLAAAAFVGVMVVAMVSVHLPNGFFAQDGGYEYTLVLAVAALSLAFTGPGIYSVDHALGFAPAGATWGLAAGALGLAGGVVQLAMRRAPATTSAGGMHEGGQASA